MQRISDNRSVPPVASVPPVKRPPQPRDDSEQGKRPRGGQPDRGPAHYDPDEPAAPGTHVDELA